MIKVKIHKIVPLSSLNTSSIKAEPFVISGQKYVPYKNAEQNYTGYPIYLYLKIILPDNNDYQYLKVDVRAQNTQFGKLIQRKNQKFTDIDKNHANREVVFKFTPMVKGKYLINVDTIYRVKYFVQGSQPPPQKRDNSRQVINCQQPLEVHEYIKYEDAQKEYITFPIFLQYTVYSKISNYKFNFKADFESQKLKVENLHENQQISLGKNQTYYLMYQLQPKSVKQIGSEKGINLGKIKINYGEKGTYEKKAFLKPTDKYGFFKGQTITRNVPKKDILQIQIKFSKVYSHLKFDLGDLKLQISQNKMPQVRILKTSVDTINLDKNSSAKVILSIICMKSGAIKLQGIELKTNQQKPYSVSFINDLLLFVGMQPEHKAEMILENTSQFHVGEQLI